MPHSRVNSTLNEQNKEFSKVFDSLEKAKAVFNLLVWILQFKDYSLS